MRMTFLRCHRNFSMSKAMETNETSTSDTEGDNRMMFVAAVMLSLFTTGITQGC